MSPGRPQPRDTDVYDGLDNHLAAAGDMARAAVPMGMLLAWCVNMQLISADLARAHERLILRLRFEEASGSELLVACGGDLRRDMFNAAGQAFLDDFYPQYMDFYADVFGHEVYAVSDNWPNYRKLSAALTRRYLGKPAGGARGGVFAKLSAWFKR